MLSVIFGHLVAILSLAHVQGSVPLTLQIQHYQSAGGTVASSPAGISCGADCSETYTEGQVVTLTASPDAGRRFAAWTNGHHCAEPTNLTTTCTVTMPAAGLDMQASWVYDTYDFSVSKTGSGSGTVTGSGVSCGADCSGTIAYGQWANLSATAAPGSAFVGWESSGSVCNTISAGPTCNIYGGGFTNPGFTAVARFDKVATSESDSTNEAADDADESEEDKDASDAKKPAVPQAHLKDESGNVLLSLSDIPVVFTPGQSIVIAGVSVPNGQVKLYIYSDPQTAEVTASKNGSWEYRIAGLAEGRHRVEAEVTDPETGATSDREQILAFEIAPASAFGDATNTASTADAAYSSDKDATIPIILGIILAASLAGGSYWWWRQKTKSTSTAPENATKK